jgi:hypothetical protein
MTIIPDPNEKNPGSLPDFFICELVYKTHKKKARVNPPW